MAIAERMEDDDISRRSRSQDSQALSGDQATHELVGEAFTYPGNRSNKSKTGFLTAWLA
jgi:hypothetical protein